MARRYDVVFHGQLLPGNEPTAVKRRLVTLFRSPEKIDALFARPSVLVKRAVAEEDAQSYRAAFERAGAAIEIVPVETAEPPSPEISSSGTTNQTIGAAAHSGPLGTLLYGSPDGDPVAPSAPPPSASMQPRTATANAIPDLEVLGAPARTPQVPHAPRAAATDPVLASETPPMELEVAVPATLGAPLPPFDAPFDSRGGTDDASPGSSSFEVDSNFVPLPETPELSRYSPNTFDEADSFADGLAIDTTTIDSEGPDAHIDISLPTLKRDPNSHAIVAFPPQAPERPDPSRRVPATAPSVQAPALSPPPASSSDKDRVPLAPPSTSAYRSVTQHPSPAGIATATDVIRSGQSLREQEVQAAAEHTLRMARALESSRFGMTVTAVSFFLLALLALCNGMGALVKAEVWGFLGAMLPIALWSIAGRMLWKTLGKFPRAPAGASTEELAGAIEQQAGFWRYWSVANAVGGGLLLVVLLVAVARGGLATAIEAEAEKAPIRIVHWEKRPSADGYVLELECSDELDRDVRCQRNPEDRSFKCACFEGGLEIGAFVSRADPKRNDRVADFVNDGCGWDLALDVEVDSLSDAF